MNSDTFSKRNNYQLVQAITIREDAPEDFRNALVVITNNYFKPSDLRDILCNFLKKNPIEIIIGQIIQTSTMRITI